MSDALVLDAALPPEGLALAHRLARRQPLHCYVEDPIPDGIGAGLTRRHDALVRHLQGLATAGGPMPDLDELGARSNLFRDVWAERGALRLPEAAPILHHPGYADAVRALTGLPHVEPTMLYVNALVPGQELMWHTDTPEFWGLDKGDVPEWLLVCMLHSGLFEEARVVVAGGVTFLGPVQGGAFGWRDADGTVHHLDPTDGNAILLDADRHAHGVLRVGGPDAPAPPVRSSSTLVPTDDGGWALVDRDRTLATYGPEEVRVSMQWKARCTGEARGEPLTVDAAVARMGEVLAARGTPLPDDPTDQALTVIEAFVPAYPPVPDAA